MSVQQAITILKGLPEKYQQEAMQFIEFLAQKLDQQQETNSTQRNGFGSLKGKVRMASDFDAPLDEFNEYM